MKLCSILITVSVLGGASFAARAAFQEGMPAKAGPEHELLKQLAGTFDAAMQAGEMTETGTSKTTVGMDGLWAITDYTSTMMGQPFNGHAVTGWDPAKKKYVDCWVDSMTSSFLLSEGTYDPATKTLTMTATPMDPTGHKPVMRTRIQDAAHHPWAMYDPDDDKKAIMSITYTRKK